MGETEYTRGNAFADKVVGHCQHVTVDYPHGWACAVCIQQLFDADPAVRACAGIPTEALEAGVVGEMREALSELLRWADFVRPRTDVRMSDPNTGAHIAARAALAKASPGGAR